MGDFPEDSERLGDPEKACNVVICFLKIDDTLISRVRI
jgi:hypothetical protein